MCVVLHYWFAGLLACSQLLVVEGGGRKEDVIVVVMVVVVHVKDGWTCAVWDQCHCNDKY